jgi:Cys-tRNA(Pro)/Cys-tRNA(Cys) deacylase
MATTNNVTRMLDAKKVDYIPHEFPPEKLSAEDVATLIGLPEERVYKTIVVTRKTPGKAILAMVPAPTEVDLKALAAATGEKKLAVATHAEAEQLTGLQTGGISPLALIQRGFDMWLDASAETHERICLSGGQRGLNLEIAPKDLIGLTRARMADIAK